MTYRYILRIDVDNPVDVEHVLGYPSSDAGAGWSFELVESADDPPTPFINKFLKLLHGKYDRLEEIGVQREQITIWLLYEYDQQCNLEFSPMDLKQLGDAGISLCVSCWQAT